MNFDVFDIFYPQNNRVFDKYRKQMKQPLWSWTEQSSDVHVSDTLEAYVVELDAPGALKEEVDVSVKDGMLVVKVDKKATPRPYSFTEKVTLGEDKVDTFAIKAKLENGVLTVTLPKKVKQALTAAKIVVE